MVVRRKRRKGGGGEKSGGWLVGWLVGWLTIACRRLSVSGLVPACVCVCLSI